MSAERTAGALPAIDLDRLWSSLESSAGIGKIPGNGLRRLALSEEDGQMRKLFVRWCEESGLAVRVDRIGNIFARRGGELDLPPVLLGSHLDSQVNGGRFDGTLGVLAALEVVRSLDDHAVQTRRPIEVVSWTDEEGARFRTGMLGASAFTGRLTMEEALAKADDDGIEVRAALDRIGFAGPAPVPGPLPHAYLELHIEQDDRLDRSGLDVGIVTGSYGVYYFDVAFEGETAHGGPTPMDKRRNALLGAANAISAANRVAQAHGPDAKSNVSTISVWPNRSGIVPSSVTARFDFRHPDPDVLEQLRGETEAAIQEGAASARVDAEIVTRTLYPAIRFDRACIEALEQGAKRRGHRTSPLLTQAAHDAMVIADFAPAAMVFCPCRDGVTHNPGEDVDPDRVAPAVEVLLEAAVELANAI